MNQIESPDFLKKTFFSDFLEIDIRERIKKTTIFIQNNNNVGISCVFYENNTALIILLDKYPSILFGDLDISFPINKDNILHRMFIPVCQIETSWSFNYSKNIINNIEEHYMFLGDAIYNSLSLLDERLLNMYDKFKGVNIWTHLYTFLMYGVSDRILKPNEIMYKKMIYQFLYAF